MAGLDYSQFALRSSHVKKDILLFVSIILCSGFGFAGAVEEVAVNISETAPKGTVLWKIKSSSNCSINGTIPHTDAYIEIRNNEIVLQKPLDLEVPNTFTDGNLTVMVNCAVGVNVKVNVHIIPENEFPPVFQQAPFYVRICEGTPVDTTVYTLKDKVIDTDAIMYGNIVSFDVNPYIIMPLDGRQLLTVDNLTGNVSTKTVIDYEHLERHNFILNITATDGGGKVSAVTLNMTIVDVDDTPPIFQRQRCYRGNCHVDTYTGLIDIHFEGLFHGISPSDIFARDGDHGINANIIYSLEGTEDDIVGNIDIDNTTGEIQVLVPYANFTNVTSGALGDPFLINVTVIATEQSVENRSAKVPFLLSVYRVLPTPSTAAQTTTPVNVTITSEDDSSSNTLLLVEILVPCLISIIFLVIVIIITLMKRQKMKEMKYKVKEKERQTRTSQHGDMMDSLPATMATPYDLVGAYANIDLTTYDKDEKGESTTEEDMYNGVSQVGFGGLYTKVKMKAPRQSKMRAVDIVEADLGDGEDEDERDGGDEPLAEDRPYENDSTEPHTRDTSSVNAEIDDEQGKVCHSNEDDTVHY